MNNFPISTMGGWRLSEAVPQLVASWGFASLSRQPPQTLRLFIGRP